jgi:hypothetical protein
VVVPWPGLVRYTRFQYIEPPRTDVRGAAQMIPALERQGWWAQFKRNGSNSIIYVSPDRTVEAWNRHGERHKPPRPGHAGFAFTPETAALFATLPGKRWWVFNGELLHAKTPHIKNTHYLFDVLVADGESLFGTPYPERYERLAMIWDFRDGTAGHFVLDEYTWLARTHTEGFAALFRSLSNPEDEGLMFKRPEGLWTGTNANSWMIKVRRPGY